MTNWRKMRMPEPKLSRFMGVKSNKDAVKSLAQTLMRKLNDHAADKLGSQHAEAGKAGK